MSNPCDSMDCSPPGSSVHGILQERILEWVAISFSNTHTHTHTHIYIYTYIHTYTHGLFWPKDLSHDILCVCACVCIYVYIYVTDTFCCTGGSNNSLSQLYYKKFWKYKMIIFQKPILMSWKIVIKQVENSR